MMRSIQLIFFLITCCLPLCLNAQADYFTQEELNWIREHPVIDHGYEPDWPPYEMYDGTKYTGIVGDYLDILEKETGIDFRPIKDITWEESMNKLRTGEVNFVPSCAITPEREKFLLFTDVIVSDPLVLVTTRNGKFLSGLDLMEGKKMALPKNYYTLEMIRRDYPDIEIIEKDKITDCLKAVSTGEADAFMGSLGVISYYINHQGFTNLKIAAPTDYPNVRIAMACTKDWAMLRDIANKVIQNITVQEHNQIREKWIAVRYEYGISSKEVINYILLGLLLAAIIIGLFYLWNRTLRKEIDRRKVAEENLKNSLEKIKKQSEERKVLLQEVHHRVKNNLQVITSMLKLQSQGTYTNDKPFNLDDTIDRINSISLIHEMIYKSEHINIEDVNAYFDSLIKKIIATHGGDKSIELEVNSDDLSIGLKTLVPLAVIINELVVNSIKHGFEGMNKGKIRLDFSSSGDDITMEYHDNGPWKEKQKSQKGFGGSLIDIFTHQLDGTFTLKTNAGTHYVFHFKRQGEK